MDNMENIRCKGIQTEEDFHELKRIRLQKLLDLQQNDEDPFGIVKYDQTHHSTDISNDFATLENTTVSIAGRLMSRRLMGQAAFCDVLDREGRIQIYVRKEDIGDDMFNKFKYLIDIGDWVGVQGVVFRTQKGEITVKASVITLLSKSLNVLPEKHHGLIDKEARYRQRYVDLIVNPDVRRTFIQRTKILRAIRNFLDNKEPRSKLLGI